jgi:hypothetical protein
MTPDSGFKSRERNQRYLPGVISRIPTVNCPLTAATGFDLQETPLQYNAAISITNRD